MRTISILFPTFVAGSIALASPYSPFFPPLESNTIDRNPNIIKRQNYCASDQVSCSNLGQPSTCCKQDSLCAVDQAGNVACCPHGAACTGSISVAVPTSTSSGSAPNAASSTTGLPTTNNAAQITSTVQNPYFPFVYVPTTYSNAAGCSSYYSSCQSEFASCTNSVGGGVNGVTVAGAGGGITVQGASATAAASSICASLSSSACNGLQLSTCSAYGSTTAGGAFVQPNAAPTHCAGVYGMGIGVAIGIGGQLLG